MDQKRWQKVEQLFNAGLELPAQERDKFWRVQCDSDKTVLAQLQLLLQGHQKAEKDNILDHSIWGLENNVAPNGQGVGSSGNLIGSIINGYQVTQLLGRGSMGEVYLANKPPLKREVVIKTIVDTGNSAFRKQFLEEMRVHEKLRHENIVVLHDAGSHGSLPYLVLEYFPSLSLRKYLRSPENSLRQRPLPLDQVFQITRQVAAGLAYAHRAFGITHRDIKPENILIALDPVLKAKIIDFGIAILPELELESLGRDFSRRYTYGASGTPLYMSPEQFKNVIAREKVCPIDSRTDIYALGLVVYEMITGQSTFPPNALRNFNRVIWPSKIRRGLPVAVDRVLKKALQDDPRSRYQSVEQFYRDLEVALRPIIGDRRTANSRKKSYWRRLTGLLGLSWPRARGR
ncbi:MAG: serine/threonine protein kinase [Acidobacteria bacterium]|nr:serine/threonine protein kinase [Acidobacteriota bacterium]